MCVCMCVVCAHEYKYPWGPEEGIRFSGAGFIDNRELSDVRAGFQTQVFCKNSTYSSPGSHHSSPLYENLKKLNRIPDQHFETVNLTLACKVSMDIKEIH